MHIQIYDARLDALAGNQAAGDADGKRKPSRACTASANHRIPSSNSLGAQAEIDRELNCT